MLVLFNYGLLGSLILAEASWLFLLFGILGALFGVLNPLFPWVGFLILLTPGFLTQRLVINSDWVLERLTEPKILLIGLATIYFMVAYSSGATWPIELLTWSSGTGASFQILIFLGTGIVMWRRGLWLGGQEDPGKSLKLLFPIGFFLATLGGLVEATFDLDLGFTPVIFLLFGSCLTGLALSRLIRPKDSKPDSWMYSPIWAIAVVLVAGFVLILLSQTPLAALTSHLFTAGLNLVQFVLTIIMIPVEYILRAIFWVMGFFIEWLRGEPNQSFNTVTPFSLEGLRDRQTEPNTFWIILSHLLSWFFIILLITTTTLTLYLILWVRLKKKVRQIDDMELGLDRVTINPIEVESHLGPVRPVNLSDLNSTYHEIPTGSDPSTQVKRAYYQLLNYGIQQGKPRLPKTTPLEYENELTNLVQNTPVDRFTQQFNDTHYGSITPSVEDANEMERMVGIAITK